LDHRDHFSPERRVSDRDFVIFAVVIAIEWQLDDE
jgi:hypothetical protein